MSAPLIHSVPGSRLGPHFREALPRWVDSYSDLEIVMSTIFSRFVIACLFCTFCVSPSFAAKKNKGQKSPAERIQKKLASADLPSDTLAKAKKVVDDNAPKLKEA